MKLTKEEKKALHKDIVEDIPEYYRIFSPWMWLWLINILLLLIGLAAGVNLFGETYGGSIPLSLVVGLIFIVFICVSNGFIVYGYSSTGLLMLRIISLMYLTIALVDIGVFSSGSFYTIILILGGGLSLWLTYTVRFQAFCLHRKRCMDWARERVKKNKAFEEKIKENRRRAGQK